MLASKQAILDRIEDYLDRHCELTQTPGTTKAQVSTVVRGNDVRITFDCLDTVDLFGAPVDAFMVDYTTLMGVRFEAEIRKRDNKGGLECEGMFHELTDYEFMKDRSRVVSIERVRFVDDFAQKQEARARPLSDLDGDAQRELLDDLEFHCVDADMGDFVTLFASRKRDVLRFERLLKDAEGHDD